MTNSRLRAASNTTHSPFTRAKRISSPRARGSEEKAARGAGVARYLSALLLTFSFAATLFAQASGENAAGAQGRQSADAAAAVLQDAEKNGSLVEATVELQVPLGAPALEYVTTSGQLHSIHIASTTSDWKGAINSTPNSPLTSFAAGLRSYELLYREAAPAEPHAFFVMTAFTVRGTASEIKRIRDSFPGAVLASVSEVSGVKQGQTLDPTKVGKAAATSSEEAHEVAAADSGAFLPSKAELNIRTLANSDRSIEVTFSWNTAADLAGLSDEKAALEIQVLFWNAAADAKRNNYSYVGAVKSWGADAAIRHAYFDTPALNGTGFAGKPEEREVTIGSTRARSDFQAGRQYKVWAVTERGALDAGFAKLSFQQGIFNPTALEGADVAGWCEYQRFKGDYNPAHCVKGKNTQIVTPTNYTGSSYSILAPTVPAFTHPSQTCSTPPGYPQLEAGKKMSVVTEQVAREIVPRVLPVQQAFARNGGRRDVGCPTNVVHKDTKWWPAGGWTQDFDGSQTGKGKGVILLAQGAKQAFWIHGAVWTRYEQMGGPKSVVGEPTGDESSVTSSKGTKGAYQGFKGGWIYFNGKTNQTLYVAGGIADKYRSVGMHTSPLGFPTREEYNDGPNGRRADFEGGHIHWTASKGAVVMLNSQAPAPTVREFTWNATPTARLPFSGTVTGNGFVTNATQLFFCANNSNACLEHPAAGVIVRSPTSLSVVNANLGAGAWQLYVRTPAGPSGRSSAFTVKASPPPPTVTKYSWSTTPVADRTFDGTVTGAGFAPGNTQLYFCQSGTNVCYQHPSAGVLVKSPNSLSVDNAKLGQGTWQVYVKTPWGTSGRSATFVVQPTAPTIGGYAWKTTPRANQNFGGTISGTGFISNGTKVWFCVAGSGKCYQHPSAGVKVEGQAKLTVSNVKLGSGSWQIYVSTAAGQSSRSAKFNVR